MAVSHVIVPAAGLGTRFLPYTKTIPKEMLPIDNKPAIQYIIDECTASGINNITLIINDYKQPLIDYLKPHNALNDLLSNHPARSVLTSIDESNQQATFKFVTQSHPLGLGHAVLQAKSPKDSTGDYVGIMLPDDIIVQEPPVMNELIRLSNQHNASVIAVMPVSKEHISSYGIIKIRNIENSNDSVPKAADSLKIYSIDDLIEKPSFDSAPSNLAVVGRYVLSKAVFDELSDTQPGFNKEIQLTDAIRKMIRKGHSVLAYPLTGKRFDIGTPAGWLEAAQYMSKQPLSRQRSPLSPRT